jgi:hypothetical protein
MDRQTTLTPPPTTPDTALVHVGMHTDWSLDMLVSPWIWGPLLAVVVLLLLYRFAPGRMLGRDYEIDSAELGLGDSKITLKPNADDRTVAYKIWVELSTRKIGLPIDPDHDVIADIYDSWYAFFAVTRELIKDIPVSKVRHKSTKKIIQLSINVLNDGLRPHLTQWQARFRRWFDYKLSTDPEARLDPQDVQKEFPQFEQLLTDMLNVNARLIRYRERMDALVHN